MLTKTQRQKNLVGTSEDVMPIEPEAISPKESHIASNFGEQPGCGRFRLTDA